MMERTLSTTAFAALAALDNPRLDDGGRVLDGGDEFTLEPGFVRDWAVAGWR